jgi:coatomer subunit beta
MEKPCIFLVHFDKGTPSMVNEIKFELESGDGPMKADTMRRAISLLLNGELLPHLFITVVRYV